MIHVSSVAVIRANHLLLCEPFRYPELILPGGTPEPAESGLNCICREVQEELGVSLDESSIVYIGRYRERSCGEADPLVEMDLYVGDVCGAPRAFREIRTIHWIRTATPSHTLSPMVATHVIPELISRKLVSW